jgi:hypothetical protein
VQEITHSQFKRAVPHGPALLVSLQFLHLAPRLVRRKIGDAGWSSPVARQAHNLKVVGSNPTPATSNSLRTKGRPPAVISGVFVVFSGRHLESSCTSKASCHGVPGRLGLALRQELTFQMRSMRRPLRYCRRWNSVGCRRFPGQTGSRTCLINGFLRPLPPRLFGVARPSRERTR